MSFRRSVTVAELWWPEVARLGNFSRNFAWLFLEKRPLTGNFQNSVPKRFTASPIDVLCSNFVKFGRRGIGTVVRYLHDKKISPGSTAVAAARIAPKVCQGQPHTMYSEMSKFRPNWFTFGIIIAERVNTIETHPKVIPIFG